MPIAPLVYLTAGDAAARLKISPAGVRLAADTGRLRIAATTPGGIRLFLPEDVDRLKRDRAKARR